MENQSQKPPKKRQKTSEPAAVLFGLIQSLLQNPAVYPQNTDTAIINMAIKIRNEMLSRGLIPEEKD